MTEMDYVVIHRMPKVAAYSIYHSLRASIPDVQITQTHFMTPQRIATARREAQIADVRPEVAASLHRQIETAVRCVEEIEKRRHQGRPYCIISGYRDPLDQLVSHLFQGLPSFFPEIDAGSEEVMVQAVFMEQKLSVMFRRLVVEQQPPATPEEGLFVRAFLDDCINWFDAEFKEFHGINLYEHEPNALGLFVIGRGPVRYLVYKLETLRAHFGAVLSLVPGVGAVKQANDNEASNKNYAPLYRAFRQRFRPIHEMHKFYYQSRYFRHFYRNDPPHFSQTGFMAGEKNEGQNSIAAQLLRSGLAELHKARASLRELEPIRQELTEARQLIARMRATKVWRLRTLLRRFLRLSQNA